MEMEPTSVDETAKNKRKRVMTSQEAKSHDVEHSKISSHFKAKKGPNSAKERTLNTSSVYLTPESSPIKDNQNDLDTHGSLSDIKKQETSSMTETAKELQLQDNLTSESDKTASNQDVSELKKSLGQDVAIDSSGGAITSHRHQPTSVSKSPKKSSLQAEKRSTRCRRKPKAVDDMSVPSPTPPRPKSAELLQVNQSKKKPKKPGPVQNNTITNYFPVRRSCRQTKTTIEYEKLKHLATLIKSDCEEGLEIKEFEGKGRGVIASKQFDSGDFVVEYAGNLMDISTAKNKETTYALNPEVGCYMYFFQHGNRQYCVDATSESGRLGRLLNHSRNGNCKTKVVEIDGMPHLILVAAQDIKPNDELTYDYGDRSKSSIEAHPWLLL